MRLRLMLCSVTILVPALLLTGCGVDQMSSPTPNVESPAIAGRAFGGQQPVAGSTISVLAMGTTGYGSTGTVLASTTTDANGNFSFTQGAYTCPQSNTPVYLLGIGGDSTGAGNNGAAVLGAALGTCANAKNSAVVMNEVTTVALAFTLSHFFSTTLGGANAANDWFGGPSTTSGGTTNYSTGLQMGNNVTAQTIVFNAIGAPNQTTASGGVVEYAKIYSIANILGDCINSNGSTKSGQPCQLLFKYTTTPSGQVPSDTLQAAVQMALNPTTNVTKLFALIPTTPAFTGGMTAAPNDWTIGVSYTSSAVGLAVNTGTLTTLDIDSAGRIWFPSNASGKVGLVYFDPASQSFNGPYNTTSLAFPQQVAIDANGYAWVNDSGAPAVSGYLTTAPAATETVSLPNTISNSVTVGADNRINVGVTAGAKYELANISASRSGYSILSGVSFVYPTQSIAGDINNGDSVAVTDPTTTTTRNYYVTSAGVNGDMVNANNDAGQVIYTGNDYISVRSWSGAGTGGNDGLCIYSTGTCYAFKGAVEFGGQGMAIDGGNHLWVATKGNAGLIEISPANNPTGANGMVYVSSTTGNIPMVELTHGGGQGAGATGTAATPYGIGVDATGNVWMTNVACAVTTCIPTGNFTLTEIVGAAYPTITPVSAQITSGNLVGTEPTQ